MSLHLHHTKTVACTRDIISKEPAINNTIITDTMFLRVFYYIVNFIIQQTRIIN